MTEPLRRNAVVGLLGTPDRTEGSLNSPVELEEHGIGYNEKWIYEHLRHDPADVPMRLIYWHRYDFTGTLIRANAKQEWRADDKLAAALANEPSRLEPLDDIQPTLTPSNRYRPVSEVKDRNDLGGYPQSVRELDALTNRGS
ncbi:MAG: hypothetical protein ACREQ4_03400 [Candidatus Binataceae bacterium]